MIRRLWLVAIIVALTGCFQPGSDSGSNGTTTQTDTNPPDGDAPGCIGRVCLADPDSHDAKHALENFGFHQLTMTSGQVGRPQVHEGLLVWQTGIESVDEEPTPERGHAPDILAYSFDEDRIMAVARSPDYLYAKPYLQDERVVYRVEPGPRANYTGTLGYWVELWDSQTGETRRLELPLNATDYEPAGFDGEWAVLAVQGSSNESEIGYWLYHVDDGRLKFLYRPSERGVPLENGTEERFRTVHVKDGIAYLGRGWKEAGEEHWTYYIHAFDIESETWNRVYRGSTNMGDVGVTQNVLVSGINYFDDASGAGRGTIGWLDLKVPDQGFHMGSDPSATIGFVRAPHTNNADWLVFTEFYGSRPENAHLLAAYSVAEQERRVIVDDYAFHPDRVSMGDEYLVVSAIMKTDVWDAYGGSKYERHNLYYMSVEELETAWHAARES